MRTTTLAARIVAVLAAPALLAVDRPRPAAAPPVSAIPACTAADTIPISEARGDSLFLMLRRLDGSLVRRLYAQPDDAPFVVDLAGGRAFGRHGLIDLSTGAVKPVTGADSLQDPGFLPSLPLVVGMLRADRATDPTALRSEILDVTNSAVSARFDGFGAAVAPDGTIYYLHAADSIGPASAGAPADTIHFIDVMRWRGSRGEILARVIIRPDEDGPYFVTAVVPLTDQRFAYRVSDGHEFRYYGSDGKSFYAEKGRSFDWEHNLGGGGGHKEQYGLVVSTDGRLAAFTERNWNQLTYLVVVDLAMKKRTQTKFFGSFPRIHGEYVVFVSDPDFVTRGGKFRQIEHYALYAYHVPTGALCEIARFPEGTAPE